MYVSFDELEELVEYAVATYNGTPHGGLNNVTPLEAIGYFVRGRQTLVTWLAEHHRRTLCLMQSARRCRVRAYLDQGVRPHINLRGARYTNRMLATSTHLIGQQLLVYMNTDDLSCVRAFLSDGAELGVLDVQGSWRLIPHNLKLRQQILKQAGERRRRGAGAPDPIGAYVEEKLAGAKTARKAATELANVRRLIASAPAAKTPSGPACQPETVAAPALDALEAPVAPTGWRADRPAAAAARPRKLSIGTLLVLGARSAIAAAPRRDDRLSRWILQLQARVGYQKTLVAIANKHARILWAILAKGEKFDPSHAPARPRPTAGA